MEEGPAWSGQTLSLMLASPILTFRHQTSIFGASELNCRVRDGNGWTLTAIDTNCVKTSFISFVSGQARKLTHSAVSPFQNKPCFTSFVLAYPN